MDPDSISVPSQRPTLDSTCGISLAEVGQAMFGIEKAVPGCTPHSLASTPTSSTSSFFSAVQQPQLSRHDTLANHSHKNSTELKKILGKNEGKLKSGTNLVSSDNASGEPHKIALEQAKSRKRVDVDIILDSEHVVQGGHLKGHAKVHIRKSSSENTVLINEAKIRVLGFESIGNARHSFYQCSASLSDISSTSHRMYLGSPDEDGYSEAVEGMVHDISFSMRLPLEEQAGNSKGSIPPHSGTSIRYVAMM